MKLGEYVRANGKATALKRGKLDARKIKREKRGVEA